MLLKTVELKHSIVAAVQPACASVKKFYAYLYEMGGVSKDDYDGMLAQIKSEHPRWHKKCDRYNCWPLPVTPALDREDRAWKARLQW